MREIKFRAWDKDGNIMYAVRDISFCGEELDTYEMQGDWIGFESIELMQYTGLKDKNGKEIYEGDIVKENEYFNCNYEVYYSKNSCSFNGIKIGDRDCNTLEFPQLAECGEVIGNIYSNPEEVPNG